MTQIDFLPDWIYTFLIIPIVLLFQKYFSLKNETTELKTTQEFYMKKVDAMCKSNEALTKEINQLLGAWKEHLRASSS